MNHYVEILRVSFGVHASDGSFGPGDAFADPCLGSVRLKRVVKPVGPLRSRVRLGSWGGQRQPLAVSVMAGVSGVWIKWIAFLVASQSCLLQPSSLRIYERGRFWIEIVARHAVKIILKLC